jgi:hypothetical protein
MASLARSGLGLFMAVQGSQGECSKKMEASSFLSLGQSNHRDSKDGSIEATSAWEECQRLCGHLLILGKNTLNTHAL